MPSTLRERITPQSIDGDQIHVVIFTEHQKVKHLVSMWLQNCNRPIDDKFYKWITTTGNTLGALDSLGMVELIYTWRFNDAGWDVSNEQLCGM